MTETLGVIRRWTWAAIALAALGCSDDDDIVPGGGGATGTAGGAAAGGAGGAAGSGGVYEPAPPTISGTVDGDDWSLPATAAQAPYSGRYWAHLGYDSPAAEGMTEPHFAVNIHFTWREVNPSEGVFDWSSIDAVVEQVEAAPTGMGFGLWPWYYDAEDLPLWLTSGYDIQFLGTGGVAPWAGDFMTKIAPMIQALGARYGSHPRLVYAEMRCPYDWEFGEYSHRGAMDEILAVGAPFLQWFNGFTDLWAGAFAGAEHKLVSQVASTWHPDTEAIIAHSYSRGTGQRDGMPSQALIIGSVYSHHEDADGYITLDSDHPPLAGRAFYGSEDTEFNPETDDFGDPAHTWYRFHHATFWSLMTRRNWLAIPRRLFDVEPYGAFIDWVWLELGHDAATAPDAWSWTNEIEHTYPPRTTKNYERWLMQRDVAPDGLTVAAEPGPDPDDLYGHWEHSAEYAARRTDASSGSSFVYYRLAPEFLSGGPQRAEIKVSYLDGPTWHLEYLGYDGPMAAPDVTPDGSGAWKTVTYLIDDLMLDGRAFDGMDFRLANGGPGELTVKLVRAVRP
ncbi:MAG: hypothetical protein JRI23_23470 [Deltaproteobacteria bacterium]|nr:hypothetical protein [Deltaproteobacteria bacterium]MBW2534949.1 hypothetical protein [Deltaproteobacteria bacterium]